MEIFQPEICAPTFKWKQYKKEVEMKRAALHNLGCKVNAYETEAMQQLLEGAGYEIVPFTESSDL